MPWLETDSWLDAKGLYLATDGCGPERTLHVCLVSAIFLGFLASFTADVLLSLLLVDLIEEALKPLAAHCRVHLHQSFVLFLWDFYDHFG